MFLIRTRLPAGFFFSGRRGRLLFSHEFGGIGNSQFHRRYYIPTIEKLIQRRAANARNLAKINLGFILQDIFYGFY